MPGRPFLTTPISHIARTARRRRIPASATARPLFIAAIAHTWASPTGQAVQQLATVSCAPSTDVESVHERMAVLVHAAEGPVGI